MADSSKLGPSFVVTLRQEISEDLSRVVDSEKLQEAVEKELLKQVASHLAHRVQELLGLVSYGGVGQDHIRIAEQQTLRAVRNLEWLILSRQSQRVLASTTESEIAESQTF